MSGLGMKYVASFINSFARRIKNMGDDITRTGTVMLGFMFVFALIFGGLSLRDLNSSWNHSVETREKLAVFLGGLFAIFAIVLLVVIKHHKRKLELQQEAINLQYLNADIDSDADDDLLDKYNEKV